MNKPDLVASLQEDPRIEGVAQQANDQLRLRRPDVAAWSPRPMPFGWVPDADTPPLPRRRRQ